MIIITGGVVVLASIFQTSVGHRMLRATGLSREPMGYTSLSFLYPQFRSEQLKTAHGNTVTSFVIHNGTGSTHDYRWSVSVVAPGRTRRVDTGSLRLAPGREAEIIVADDELKPDLAVTKAKAKEEGKMKNDKTTDTSSASRSSRDKKKNAEENPPRPCLIQYLSTSEFSVQR